MRLPCKVVEDLLPIYYDEVCSEETKEIVEEHLLCCDSCKQKLKFIEDDIVIPKQDREAVNILKNIKKEMKAKETKKIILILAIFTAVLLLYHTLQFKLRPISTEKMNITQVATLSDGFIGFELEMTGNNSFQAIDVTYDADDESIIYITPISAVFPNTPQYDTAYCFYDVDNSFLYETYGPICNSEKCRTENVKRIYLGSEKDHVLIWEEGMKLPKASAELEEAYQNVLNK